MLPKPCFGLFGLRNRSRDYNAHFTTTYRTVSVYRVLQMRGVRIRRRTSCTSSARQQSRCGAL
ncbi:MAG: hypothetical protein K8R75_06790 [Deltaproteobacteria bacterium]|nr:hypothetical protein [Deltaproteobacteria bacterium]